MTAFVGAQETPRPAIETPREAATASSPAVAAASANVPASPEDPLAAKAYAVLDRHCATCHQTGKLKAAQASGRIASILDLGTISADRTLVRPGNPDGSELYNLLLARTAPHEILGGPEEPTVEEVQALRDWIQALATQPTAPCRTEDTLDAASLSEAIIRHIDAQPEDKRKSLRFVSLAPLQATCRTRPLVGAYAQAVAKMLNGLSWAKAPVRLEPVDEKGVVLKVDLDALGLVAAHWDRLASGYPFADATATLIRATGAQVPLLRADWLASRVLVPGVADEVLGLPARFTELQRLLQIDIEANARSGKVVRGGLKESAVVKGGRIVERHQLSSGGFWLAYDFAGNAERRNIFEYPLGPSQSVAGRPSFRHDGARAAFQLPNGFFAYAVLDARGDRLTQVADGINRVERAATSCAGCHRSGLVRIKDEIRALAEAERSGFRPDLRDAVLATYAPAGALDRDISADIVSFATAQQAAGITPSLTIEGHEPVEALADAYNRAVDLDRLAADLGVAPAEAQRRLAALSGELAFAGRKLKQGAVSRAEANRIIAVLGSAANPPAGGDTTEGTTRSLDLVLWSDKERYKPGDLVRFGARASADCHLTLVSLDTAGRATVLYPNEFEQSNLVTAGQEIAIPGGGAPYQLRAKDRGRETLVGICAASQKLPEGVYPDYERQRFTMLGNWANFIASAYTEEGGDRRAGEQKQPEQKNRAKRKARGRQDPAKAEQRRRDPQVRTAITYEIE
jgi:mono/diheme cytochrome c family protein